MMSKDIKKIFKSKFYRSRYILSYIILSIILINIIYLLIYFSPSGLKAEEITEISNIKNFSFKNLINFPYHLIQIIIFKKIGLNIFTAKIIPIFFGILSLFLFYISLIKYIDKKIALAGLTIFTFSSNLLFIFQDTRPMSYIFFLQSLIFYLIIKLVNTKKENNNLLILLTTFVISLSFYSPNIFYLAIAGIIIAIIHPKVRLFFKKIELKTKISSAVILITSLLPLIINFIQNPKLINKFLLINNNTLTNFSAFSKLFYINNNEIIFSFALIFIMLIGLLNALRKIHSVNYLSIAMILNINFIVGIFVINDLSYILSLPGLFLTIAGIEWLINHWDSLFPYNPYARFVSSLFLILITLTLSISSAHSDFLIQKYNPKLANRYSKDLTILLNNVKKDRKIIVGDKKESNFYELAGYKTIIYNNNFKNIENTIFTKSAFEKSPKLFPKSILTNEKKNNFDRFYLY